MKPFLSIYADFAWELNNKLFLHNAYALAVVYKIPQNSHNKILYQENIFIFVLLSVYQYSSFWSVKPIFLSFFSRMGYKTTLSLSYWFSEKSLSSKSLNILDWKHVYGIITGKNMAGKACEILLLFCLIIWLSVKQINVCVSLWLWMLISLSNC